MTKRAIVYSSFSGGLATDLKMGIKSSFAGTAGADSLGSYALDFRKSPSQFTILPEPSREDGGVVKELVQNEVMTSDGTIYAIGNSGGVYRRTTGAVWSLFGNVSMGTAGLDYRKDTDSIYIPELKSVGVINKVSTAPAIFAGYYGASFSTLNNTDTVGFNVAAYQAGSRLTTAIGTSIVEGNVTSRFFQSDIEPLVKIGVNIINKGTGDWTLTLHDGDNNVLGSATITNGNLNNGAVNYFVFSSAPNGQVRIYVEPNARTYHFHVTSTVADGTVSSSTSNDLSSCDCEVWADRLIQPNNQLHPMTRFQQYECFGNANYLSIWEPISTPPTNSEWLRHKLVFPSEYEVCGLAVFNEFLVIACERNTSSSTSIPQEGIIFFWDGVSPTYNYLTKIPEGSPYSIHEYKNAIFYYAGGAWYGITSPTSTPLKIRTMPGTDTTYSGAAAPITVYPNSATVRRGIHIMGWPGFTTNSDINYGLYSWGAVDKNFSESFGYSYLISTGSTNYSSSNNLTIGMVKSFGDTMHIAWRDSLNGGYGIDVINNSSLPATNSSLETLITDNGYPAKFKKAIYIQATFLTLPDDCSFKLKYKINREDDWHYSNEFSINTTGSASFGANYARFDTPHDYYEFQAGIDVTSGATTPTFTSFCVVFDDNKQEELS